MENCYYNPHFYNDALTVFIPFFHYGPQYWTAQKLLMLSEPNRSANIAESLFGELKTNQSSI